VLEAGSRRFVEPDTTVVKQMADTIIHRGPDDYGDFSIVGKDWAVNMAMRRLAIIDREGGRQPMHTGKVDLVFNGEIYGHRRLQHNLSVVGVPFKTHSDTEVIGRLWDREGVSCLDQLDGMFAIGIWDRATQTLYLARDRLGKKPAYYWFDESRNIFVVGSEIKAILAHPRYHKEINPEGLYHYLSLQYVPEPQTAFKGIVCVPAGHYVAYRPAEGKLDVVKWWGPRPNDGDTDIGDRFTVKVRQVVSEAIACRLESDVPLGVYLSGGVDSAIIAAVAKQHLKELHTFSMGFAESSYNELPLAKQTAEYLGTIHHEAIVQLPQLPEMAQRIVDQYDQPFGDCSAIPTMLLAEESKKYITVALTGDGGDEAFGGYERYWVYDGKAGIVGYIPWLSVMPFRVVNHILDPEFAKSIIGPHTLGWMFQQAAMFPGNDLLNQMMWLDTRTYLPNDIIVKMERASMAASVEARCPFLDHRVIELALAIPSSLKIAGNTGKLILKDAFRDMVPLSVLLRPKRGFSVPVGEWFRSEIGRQMLVDMTTDLNWPWAILDGPKVASVLDAHLKGQTNMGHPIWLILMLHLWMQRNFG